jgi:hypothetical protein
MNIATVATPIVPALDAGDGVTMCLIFRPGDPIGLTEVVIDPEPAEDARVLDLLDAAIARLACYRDGYRHATEEEARPMRLPAPWYGWGR